MPKIEGVRRVSVPVVAKVTEADSHWDELKTILDEHEADKSRILLIIAATAYGTCCEILSAKELITDTSRVVVEKPIGYCGKSAEEINAKLHNSSVKSRFSVLTTI